MDTIFIMCTPRPSPQATVEGADPPPYQLQQSGKWDLPFISITRKSVGKILSPLDCHLWWERELTLTPINCRTWENGPLSSPGQPSLIDPFGMVPVNSLTIMKPHQPFRGVGRENLQPPAPHHLWWVKEMLLSPYQQENCSYPSPIAALGRSFPVPFLSNTVEFALMVQVWDSLL